MLLRWRWPSYIIIANERTGEDGGPKIWKIIPWYSESQNQHLNLFSATAIVLQYHILTQIMHHHPDTLQHQLSQLCHCGASQPSPRCHRGPATPCWRSFRPTHRRSQWHLPAAGPFRRPCIDGGRLHIAGGGSVVKWRRVGIFLCWKMFQEIQKGVDMLKWQ